MEVFEQFSAKSVTAQLANLIDQAVNKMTKEFTHSL